jgi:hypothetical protein
MSLQTAYFFLFFFKPFSVLSCCRTAVGVGQRALSLSAHTAGGPPPLLAPGRVTSPRHTLGVWLVLLWRRCCGERVVFNHPRKSLNPFPSHRRSSSRALFPPPPSPVASVAWITERGDDVVRQRSLSPLNTPQRGIADTREHRLRPGGLATVIRQVSAFSLRPETGSYGRLA